MNLAVVVPVSGGKDSQLTLQLAVEQHGASKVIGAFCDTNFEHTYTYEHVEYLRRSTGVHIERLSSGSVESSCLKNKRFPSSLSRFCTDELKMKPTRDFLKDLSSSHRNFEVWYGMRSAESTARAKKYGLLPSDSYFLHDLFPEKYPKLLAGRGVSARLPIVHVATRDVLPSLKQRANPLYAKGFGRVGCFPCLASGPKAMAKAFGFDAVGAEHSRRVIAISSVIGKDPMSSDGSPCSVCMI